MPQPTEYEEQVYFIQYLEVLQRQGHKIKFTAIPNSTYTKSWSQKAKNKASGLRPGLPDLFLIINSYPIFIEMKRTKRGVVSPKQKDWLQSLKDAGLDCYVCKGAQEAIEIVKKYL